MTNNMNDLVINKTKYRLPDNQYVKKETKKDCVVLHFTAGSGIDGAYTYWKNTKERICTAYIIDPSGNVYEIFDPKYWGFALGAGQKYEERAIQIEFVNVGPLVKKNNGIEDILCWWPKDFGQKWCALSEKNKYVHVPEGHRGYKYFATFPDDQLKAGAELVKTLCKEFNIPVEFPVDDNWDKFDTTFFGKFRGICSHQNFRKDKSDIGPGFDLKKFKEFLTND